MTLKLFIFQLLLLALGEIIAQPITFNNRYTFGFPASAITNIEVNDSCYYFTGIIADTLPPFNTGNIFGKTDFEGKIEYYKTIENKEKTYEIWGNSFEPLAKNFYSSGYSLNRENGRRGFIIKQDENGDTTFFKYINKRYNIENDGIFPSVLQSDFRGDLISMEEIASPERITETWVAKYDTLGKETWAIYIKDDNFHLYPRSLLIEKDGYIIGIGKASSGFKNFKHRTYLIKVDTAGNKLWDYQLGTLSEEPFGIIRTQDNGLVVGTVKSYEVPVNDASSLLYRDMYVFKIDSTRRFRWGTYLRGPTGSIGNAISRIIEAPDSSGYMVAGFHVADDNSTILGVIGKVSLEGDSLWMRQYIFENDTADYSYNLIRDLKASPDGGYIMVGENWDFTSPIIQYGWMLKVDDYGCLVPGCHLVNVKEPEAPQVFTNIYPNPTSDFLNFYFQSEQYSKLEYRISNMEGKILKSGDAIRDATHVVSVYHLPPGGYVLQLIRGNIPVKHIKFIKQ